MRVSKATFISLFSGREAPFFIYIMMVLLGAVCLLSTICLITLYRVIVMAFRLFNVMFGVFDENFLPASDILVCASYKA